ncbi:hypothetical protein JCM19233_1086 [Vibrio astriarenae]|nr:hypothetical protein JCM19233_1086 [Vibrio sp. C7]
MLYNSKRQFLLFTALACSASVSAAPSLGQWVLALLIPQKCILIPIQIVR